MKRYLLINKRDGIIDSEGYLTIDEKTGEKMLVDEEGEYINFVDYDWSILVSLDELVENYLKKQ